MNKNDQQFVAQKIRTQYMEKQTTELDALRLLDKKVKRPVHIFSYILGSIAAIVMGAGMSLVMTDIGGTVGFSGNAMIPGIIIGIVGLALAILNYPLHCRLLALRKQKYAPEILRLSDELMK